MYSTIALAALFAAANAVQVTRGEAELMAGARRSCQKEEAPVELAQLNDVETCADGSCTADACIDNPEGPESVCLEISVDFGEASETLSPGEQRFRDWLDSQTASYQSGDCKYYIREVNDCCTEGAENSYRSVVMTGTGCGAGLRLGAKMEALEWDNLLYVDERDTALTCGEEDSSGNKECWFDLTENTQGGWQNRPGDYGYISWVASYL